MPNDTEKLKPQKQNSKEENGEQCFASYATRVPRKEESTKDNTDSKSKNKLSQTNLGNYNGSKYGKLIKN